MTRPRLSRGTRIQDENGTALVVLLLVTPLLAALGAALVSVSMTETLISGAYRASREVEYAIDAALERSLHDLANTPDWTVVLAAPPANLTAAFSDPLLFPIAPDGRRLDLGRLTTERQAQSDAMYRQFGADTPAWRLYAHVSLRELVSPVELVPPGYLIVWVSDDCGDADGNPARDSNGRIWLFIDGYGAGGARRRVEAALERTSGPAIRLLSWREVR